MVFPGFRFRLKWVFRQYDSEIIEFWGFNVEREMKKKNTENDLYLWLMAKMNEWMNEWMVSTLALLDLSEVTDQSVWETNVFQFSKLPI